MKNSKNNDAVLDEKSQGMVQLADDDFDLEDPDEEEEESIGPDDDYGYEDGSFKGMRESHFRNKLDAILNEEQ